MLKIKVKNLLKEELSSSDKSDIKDMFKKELERFIDSKELKKLIEDEIHNAVSKDKKTREEIADLYKKITKELYKDLSINNSYIIDRIKV
jgi:3-methyladenine DNA glycosylase AlkD